MADSSTHTTAASSNENDALLFGRNKLCQKLDEVKTAESKSTEEEVPPIEFTEAQMKRIIKCRTYEGDIIEAPWHLMIQSRTFADLWTSLDIEETLNNEQQQQQQPQPEKGEADMDTTTSIVEGDGGGPLAQFIFPLNTIRTQCFERVLDWMREHHGKPEPVIKEDPVTFERVWFKLTDWERQFFSVDFETIKELYLAANFLNIYSLYIYCAMECARNIMDKSAEEIREMLCLPDDMTEEEKEQVRREFKITPTTAPALAANATSAEQAASNQNGGGAEQPQQQEQQQPQQEAIENGNQEKEEETAGPSSSAEATTTSSSSNCVTS